MQNPIDTVLEAERQAEVVIQSHRDQARKTISGAMEDARAIAERSHNRITAIHNRCSAQVKSRCDEMWQVFLATPQDTINDLVSEERLSQIAARVAAKLTGGRDA